MWKGAEKKSTVWRKHVRFWQSISKPRIIRRSHVWCDVNNRWLKTHGFSFSQDFPSTVPRRLFLRQTIFMSTAQAHNFVYCVENPAKSSDTIAIQFCRCLCVYFSTVVVLIKHKKYPRHSCNKKVMWYFRAAVPIIQDTLSKTHKFVSIKKSWRHNFPIFFAGVDMRWKKKVVLKKAIGCLFVATHFMFDFAVKPAM